MMAIRRELPGPEVGSIDYLFEITDYFLIY
jgi:hypothetical protein